MISRRFHGLLIPLLLLLGLASRAGAVLNFVPSGFVADVVASGLPFATGVAFAPDGRIFIALKGGVVRVWENGALLPTPFIDLSARVCDCHDRGLLGIAVHPDFPQSPYVYLLFTYDPPGVAADDSSGARVSRLVRVEADPASGFNVALPGSTQAQSTPGGPGHWVMLGTNSTLANIGNPDDGTDVTLASCMVGFSMANAPIEDCIPSDHDSHSGGTLVFGTDGSLFVSHGDGSSYTQVDPRSLRSQNLDSLAGKVLRIDRDTGLGLSDNPFFDAAKPGSNRSKVWAYGLRNPFRIALNLATNDPSIGDVGWSTWEEINFGKGGNFGWPCYEGGAQASVESGLTTSLKQPGYETNTDTEAACAVLYGQGLGAVRPPVFSYSHYGNDGYGSTGGAAANAGAFYPGGAYPASFKDRLFIADYSRRWIRTLSFDAQGVATVANFAKESANGVVQVLRGPDTNLYVVTYKSNGSQLLRVRYVAGGNTPPTAVASAEPASGSVPLAVLFSSLGTFDPDAQALSYAWDFGDGATSTQEEPSHTYLASGTYTAILQVTEQTAPFASGSASVVITVGSVPPVAVITAPPSGATFAIGDLITYAGTASANGSPLPAGALTWEKRVHHNEHLHYDTLPGGSGGSLLIDDHGDGVWFELCLTATDQTLVDTQCVNVLPRQTPVTLDSDPVGVLLIYEEEGVQLPTPALVLPTVGAQRTVTAPLVQQWRTFDRWDDGITARSRQFIANGTPLSFLARYTNRLPTATASAVAGTGPARASVAFDGAGSSDPEGGTLLYDWSFGDGTSASGIAVTHVYAAPGSYTATLSVTDPAGGVGVTTALILIPNSAPVAAFSRTPSSGLTPLSVSFDASASSDPDGDALAYAWDFGDGATASGAMVSHTYQTPGAFTATLGVSDPFAITATFQLPVTVAQGPNQPPVAVAAATPTQGVAPLGVSFDASGSSDADGSVAGYAWDFGDGASGSGVAPTHIYATAGSYLATVTVTDDDGASTAASVAIAVSSFPSGWWNPSWTRRSQLIANTQSFATDLVGFPLLVVLDPTRIDYAAAKPDGSDLRFLDDDQQTVLAHEIESWSSGGTSYVWVRVPRLTAQSSTDHVWMYYGNAAAPGSANPAALWSGYRSVWHLGNQTVDATGLGHQATPTGGPLAEVGRIGSATRFDGVDDRLVVNHAADLSFSAAQSYTLSAWIKVESLPNRWRGLVTKSRNASPWYGLWLSNANSWTSGAGVNLNSPTPATLGWAHVAAVQDGPANQRRLYVNAQLVNTGTAQAATGTGPLWIGGASGVNEYFNGVLDEVRLAPTPHSAAWIQADLAAANGSLLSFLTTPLNEPPLVSFIEPTPDSIALAPATFPLRVNAVDTDGSILRVDFFGDGVFLGTDSSAPYAATWSNIPSGYHVAAAVGVDDDGASTTASVTVQALDLPAIVQNPSHVTADAGATASFTVTASGSAPLGYQWKRNGAVIPGATAPAYTTPPVTVDDDGAVFACTVSNLIGSATSAGAVLSVVVPNQPPVAVAAATPTQGVAPLGVSFDASGSSDADGSVTGYAWSFGDGASGSGVAPSHIYATAGSYLATVTVTDDEGASTAASVTVQALDLPAIVQGPSHVTANAGATASFAVTASGSAPLGYQWKRNAAVIPGATAPAYTTPPVTIGDDGAVFACTVSNPVGSATSAGAVLSVVAPNQPPVAVAVATPTEGVAPLGVSFDASGSSDADGSVAGYAWSFGDGASGSGVAPSHIYATAGSYLATVTVTDDDGASATASVTVAVSSSSSGWWNPSWTRRRQLIANTQSFATDLVGFPLLVVLDPTRIDYAAAKPDGSDLRFLDDDQQTVLAHEIEAWSSGGTSYVWVRVPRLNAQSSTDHVWMYYGNPAAPGSANPAALWSGYRSVWHLGNQTVDATGLGHQATPTGGPLAEVGRIGSATRFDGVDDRLVVTHAADLSFTAAQSYTLSAWIKVESLPNRWRGLVAKSRNRSPWYGLWLSDTNLWVAGGGVNVDSPAPAILGWAHVAVVQDGPANQRLLYVNAQVVNTGAAQAATGTGPLWIGGASGVSEYFNGVIDEVRLAPTPHSAAWIQADLAAANGSLLLP